MSFKDDVKPWFQTNDFPTQEQFYQTFDKLRWKDENLTIAEVDGLQIILSNLSVGSNRPERVATSNGFQFVMPAEYKLNSIAIFNATTSSVDLIIKEHLLTDEMAHPTIAAGEWIDLDFGKTYWVETIIDCKGFSNLDGNLIFLIDRK